MVKICTGKWGCRRELPIDEFAKASGNRGFKNLCRECVRKRDAHYRANAMKRAPAMIGRKVCARCTKRKHVTDFHVDRKRTDGRNVYCKPCQRERVQESDSYQRANSKRRERRAELAAEGVPWIDIIGGHSAKEMKQARMERNRRIVWEIKRRRGCADCAIDDPRVLHFDHVRGIKFRSISQLCADGARVELLMEELAKCDVVCANHHMIRTAERAGWWTPDYNPEAAVT